jgi:hypothetical protein
VPALPSACFSEDFRKAQCYALCTRRRSHGGHAANQRAASTGKDKRKPSSASLRLRGRSQMQDVQSGRLYIVHQFQVAGAVSIKVAGNHLLLSVTRRSERCRSGSQISGAGLYERHGAKGRCRSVEGCGILDELNLHAIEVRHRCLAPDCIRGFCSLNLRELPL